MSDLGISTDGDKDKKKIQEMEWLYDSSMSSNPIHSRKLGTATEEHKKDFIPQQFGHEVLKCSKIADKYTSISCHSGAKRQTHGRKTPLWYSSSFFHPKCFEQKK